MGLAASDFSGPTDKRGQFHIIKFEPELDMMMAPVVKKRFEEAAARKMPLYVLDFSGVSYLDSTIISQLVTFRELMKDRGANVRILCIGRKDHLSRLFQITGLDRFFTIYSTVESALG